MVVQVAFLHFQRPETIVLNRSIGVPEIGVSNDTSRESGVAVVNFLTFWVYRLIRYGTYPCRSLQITR